MKTARSVWTKQEGWGAWTGELSPDRAELVLLFGSTDAMKGDALEQARERYPNAYLCGCSTAGEIAGDRVLDDTMVATAIRFDGARFHPADVHVSSASQSYEAGAALAASLPREGLVHALVLSDGLGVNGTELVAGINEGLPEGVVATGGLSGDGARFTETYVCADGKAARNHIVMLGLYGEGLRVGYGSMGGWDAFGPERRITRAKGNVLFELDGRSALALYKEYLGEHANDLPASGLLFPLAVRSDENATDSVVRTILAVDEADQSMTFAGDMNEGALARLMHANFDRLVDGAAGAAQKCQQKLGASTPDLAILISCVGRKLLLKQRVEEEVEGVGEVLGSMDPLTGFYSYGEISPFTPDAKCTLHNQTMTITTLSEV